MRYNTGIAAALLLSSVILLLSTSLYITPLTISDTNPASYVIVPLLMLPIFIFFSLKERPVPSLGRRSFAFGVVALAIFILSVIALRLYFSYLFVSFRLDMLLMPLALAGIVSLFFGIRNIRKFRWAMVYSLLASPAVLYALISQSGAFAQANSFAVYALLEPFIPGLGYSAPITITASAYSIGIGQSCVSLGIFVSLALFLVPIAYFFGGRLSRKSLWFASGVALLLVLNLARMASISLLWLSSGPSATLLLVHQIIGSLLFYAAIVVMILIASLFGLRLPRPSRDAGEHAAYGAGIVTASAIAAFALAVLYVCITLNYSTALYMQPTSVGGTVSFNFSNPSMAAAVRGAVNTSGYESVYLASQNGTEAVAYLTNSSITASNAIIALFGMPSGGVVAGLASNNKVIGERRFFGRSGVPSQTIYIISNDTAYVVYNTNMPLQLSNSSMTTTGIYMVIPAIDIPSNVSCNSYDPFYSYISSMLLSAAYNATTAQRLVAAECIANSIL